MGKWVTIRVYRGYEIKILNGAAAAFDYMVDDLAFSSVRFKTAAQAVRAIDKRVASPRT